MLYPLSYSRTTRRIVRCLRVATRHCPVNSVVNPIRHLPDDGLPPRVALQRSKSAVKKRSLGLIARPRRDVRFADMTVTQKLAQRFLAPEGLQ